MAGNGDGQKSGYGKPKIAYEIGKSIGVPHIDDAIMIANYKSSKMSFVFFFSCL